MEIKYLSGNREERMEEWTKQTAVKWHYFFHSLFNWICLHLLLNCYTSYLLALRSIHQINLILIPLL